MTSKTRKPARTVAIWIECDGAPDVRVPGTWPVRYAREVASRAQKAGITIRTTEVRNGS